jgi:hypothetical protein
MKKTLIGLCNNVFYHEEKIRLWSKSFRNHSDGNIVLLVANMSEEDKLACDRLGIDFETCTIEDTYHINHKRLEHIKCWLQKSDTDLVLSTDVFDVFFQGDPFEKLDIDNYDIWVSGEGVNVNQCPWNHQNVSVLFPNSVDSCRSKEIINSGIIAGKRLPMISLYEKMIDLCENVSTDAHNIKDQAALIVLVGEDEIPRLKKFNLDDAWAMHCHVSGPSHFFEAWGYKNNIKYGLPKIENNLVLTADGKRYDLVHQFNRIPIWDKIIKKSISVNSTYVVSSYYRTLEGDGNNQIKKFSKNFGESFYVLFDNQTNKDPTEVSEKYESNVCSYNDEDFAKHSFDKPIDRSHRWGSHQNPKYFYAHYRMLMFYLNHPNFDYYWFLDDDISFDGDIKGFLDSYNYLDDDFIAIQAFKKEEYSEFPRVSALNARMLGSRGAWLGWCPGPGDKFKSVHRHFGCFFPITRFSKRALNYLFRIHEEGYYGYHEGFVPTSLASAGFKVSSMMDEFNNFFIESDVNCTLYHKGAKFTWEWL